MHQMSRYDCIWWWIMLSLILGNSALIINHYFVGLPWLIPGWPAPFNLAGYFGASFLAGLPVVWLMKRLWPRRAP